jgi:hypothetical protein
MVEAQHDQFRTVSSAPVPDLALTPPAP